MSPDCVLEFVRSPGSALPLAVLHVNAGSFTYGIDLADSIRCAIAIAREQTTTAALPLEVQNVINAHAHMHLDACLSAIAHCLNVNILVRVGSLLRGMATEYGPIGIDYPGNTFGGEDVLGGILHSMDRSLATPHLKGVGRLTGFSVEVDMRYSRHTRRVCVRSSLSGLSFLVLEQ